MTEYEEQVSRGEQAQQILTAPLYIAAFADIERELFEELAKTNMHDTASQQELLRSVKNLRRLRGVLERHMANGEAAKQLLARSMRDRLLNAVGY